MQQNNTFPLNAIGAAGAAKPELRLETVERAERPKPSPSHRDLSLDFVKGFLLVVMVVHHATDYFVVESAATATVYRYIHFVSGAFIFSAGYVVANFYKDKFARNKVKTANRLIGRG